MDKTPEWAEQGEPRQHKDVRPRELTEKELAAIDDEVFADPVLIAEFVGSSDLARTTRQKYQQCLSEFSEFLDGWRVPSLRHAQRRDVLRFLAWLDGEEHASPPIDRYSPKDGRWPTHHRLSASSRKGYLSALRGFYRYCLDADLLEYDPTSGIRAPKVDIKPGLTVGADELRRFLDARGGERDRIQAHLFVFTAARAGELRNLRWRDIDWANRELTLYGKGGKTNVLPIHDELLGALSRWRRAQESEAEANPLIAAALQDDETAFVLLTRAGRQVTVQTLGKQVKWRAARADLLVHSPTSGAYHENKSRLHPHALRRSWATLRRRQGVALEDIADVLSHASVDTTRKHYAFSPSEKKQKTVKSFALS